MTEESSYALRQLEDAVEDALESDCTPDEIYSVIRTVARRKMLYYRACAKGAGNLLDLMNGLENRKNWVDYTELPTGDSGKVDMGGPIENPYVKK
jgi:hypothetical protein|tara:strand:- start:3119 stop:3403 length:285 start_codon:yes stop_codon:yes gene_type:complete